jgi:hypothetical protein
LAFLRRPELFVSAKKEVIHEGTHAEALPTRFHTHSLLECSSFKAISAG